MLNRKLKKSIENLQTQINNLNDEIKGKERAINVLSHRVEKKPYMLVNKYWTSENDQREYREKGYELIDNLSESTQIWIKTKEGKGEKNDAAGSK